MKLLIAIILLFSSVSSAQDAAMKRFLRCSFYGTMVGAGLGLASLAFTEDPGKKLNTIARGASLGLYAGMAWGALGDPVGGATDVRSDDYGSLSSPPAGFVSLIPDSQGKISVQSQWTFFNF